MAEHFVVSPHWEWYVLAYFYLGGLAGGLYALATLLRLGGGAREEAVARTGFVVAFPLIAVSPILLTLDLGSPLRFWHMLISTTPGQPGIALNFYSPISVGSWVLLIFGFFSLVSLLEALALDGHLRHPVGRSVTRTLSGGTGRAFNVIGAILGLFVASYTGVVLSASNQPLWSDSWAIGGLFLASALGGAAALLGWMARGRREAEPAEQQLRRADGYFAILELALIVLFFGQLAAAGMVGRALSGSWAVLWLLVLLSLVPPLAVLGGRGTAGRRVAVPPTVVFVSVLLGTLLMRFVVIWSAQA